VYCAFYLQFFNYVLCCMCCMRLSYWIKITYLLTYLHQSHGSNFIKPYPIFQNFQLTDSRKFAIKLILKIQSHLIHVATLPCRTLIFENKRYSQTNVVINDKSQGSVCTHLRCGKILKRHFLTNLLLSLPVKTRSSAISEWPRDASCQ